MTARLAQNGWIILSKAAGVGHRECHAGGDFLIVYKLDEQAARYGKLYFVRIGTHAELFDE